MKKLLVVSLGGSRRMKAYAVYDGDMLTVAKAEPISGMFMSWKPRLIDDLKKAAADGFDILIEDRTQTFQEYGFCLGFDEVYAEEGRTFLNVALDHYTSLTNMGEKKGSQRGRIILAGSLQSSWFSDETLDVEQDEKGRNRYRMDHSAFSSEQRCILLSILAGPVMHQMSDRYIGEFMDAIGIRSEPAIPPSLYAITIGVDQQLAKRLNGEG